MKKYIFICLTFILSATAFSQDALPENLTVRNNDTPYGNLIVREIDESGVQEE